MKKTLVTVLLTTFIIASCCLFARAASADDFGDIVSTAQQMTDEMLSEMGIDSVDFDSLFGLSPSSVFNVFKRIVRTASGAPFRAGARLAAVMTVFAVINVFNVSGAPDSPYYRLVENSVILMSVIFPLSTALGSAVSVCSGATNFMLCYIPVFTAAVSASGLPLSSYVYSASMLGFANVCNVLTSAFLLPVIGVFTSLNIFASLEANVRIERITSAIKKIITVVLSASATLFVGFVNLKAKLAVSADSLVLRGVKIASGGFIPVIGSALGDAISSSLAALGVIRSTLGAFGIIAVVLCFAPCIIELLEWYLTLTVCSVFAYALDLKTAGGVLDGLLGCVSVLNIVITLCAVVFVLTTGNLLSLRG